MTSDPTQPPTEIDALIERCLAGDQDAWVRIVRQHWRKVFNVAYKFTGKHDEAEDLTQDIFVKIFKSLHTFDRRANFQTWLISISRNLCIDHYRSVRKERETISRDVDSREMGTATQAEPGPLAGIEREDQRAAAAAGPQPARPDPAVGGAAARHQGIVVPGDCRDARPARRDGQVAHQPGAHGTCPADPPSAGVGPLHAAPRRRWPTRVALERSQTKK